MPPSPHQGSLVERFRRTPPETDPGWLHLAGRVLIGLLVVLLGGSLMWIAARRLGWSPAGILEPVKDARLGRDFHHPPQPAGSPGPRAILTDLVAVGPNLVAATRDQGVLRIRADGGLTGFLEEYDAANSALTEDDIDNLSLDRRYLWMLGAEATLSVCRPGKHRFVDWRTLYGAGSLVPGMELSAPTVTRLAVTPRRDLLVVGTRADGVGVYDVEARNWARAQTGGGQARRQVADLRLDLPWLWVASQGGLDLYRIVRDRGRAALSPQRLEAPSGPVTWLEVIPAAGGHRLAFVSGGVPYEVDAEHRRATPRVGPPEALLARIPSLQGGLGAGPPEGLETVLTVDGTAWLSHPALGVLAYDPASRTLTVRNESAGSPNALRRGWRLLQPVNGGAADLWVHDRGSGQLSRRERAGWKPVAPPQPPAVEAAFAGRQVAARERDGRVDLRDDQGLSHGVRYFGPSPVPLDRLTSAEVAAGQLWFSLPGGTVSLVRYDPRVRGWYPVADRGRVPIARLRGDDELLCAVREDGQAGYFQLQPVERAVYRGVFGPSQIGAVAAVRSAASWGRDFWFLAEGPTGSVDVAHYLAAQRVITKAAEGLPAAFQPEKLRLASGQLYLWGAQAGRHALYARNSAWHSCLPAGDDPLQIVAGAGGLVCLTRHAAQPGDAEAAELQVVTPGSLARYFTGRAPAGWRALLADRAGRLWGLAESGKLCGYDPATGSWSVIRDLPRTGRTTLLRVALTGSDDLLAVLAGEELLLWQTAAGGSARPLAPGFGGTVPEQLPRVLQIAEAGNQLYVLTEDRAGSFRTVWRGRPPETPLEPVWSASTGSGAPSEASFSGALWAGVDGDKLRFVGADGLEWCYAPAQRAWSAVSLCRGSAAKVIAEEPGRYYILDGRQTLHQMHGGQTQPETFVGTPGWTSHHERTVARYRGGAWGVFALGALAFGSLILLGLRVFAWRPLCGAIAAALQAIERLFGAADELPADDGADELQPRGVEWGDEEWGQRLEHGWLPLVVGTGVALCVGCALVWRADALYRSQVLPYEDICTHGFAGTVTAFDLRREHGRTCLEVESDGDTWVFSVTRHGFAPLARRAGRLTEREAALGLPQTTRDGQWRLNRQGGRFVIDHRDGQGALRPVVWSTATADDPGGGTGFALDRPEDLAALGETVLLACRAGVSVHDAATMQRRRTTGEAWKITRLTTFAGAVYGRSATGWVRWDGHAEDGWQPVGAPGDETFEVGGIKGWRSPDAARIVNLGGDGRFDWDRATRLATDADGTPWVDTVAGWRRLGGRLGPVSANAPSPPRVALLPAKEGWSWRSGYRPAEPDQIDFVGPDGAARRLPFSANGRWLDETVRAMLPLPDGVLYGTAYGLRLYTAAGETPRPLAGHPVAALDEVAGTVYCRYADGRTFARGPAVWREVGSAPRGCFDGEWSGTRSLRLPLGPGCELEAQRDATGERACARTVACGDGRHWDWDRVEQMESDADGFWVRTRAGVARLSVTKGRIAAVQGFASGRSAGAMRWSNGVMWARYGDGQSGPLPHARAVPPAASADPFRVAQTGRLSGAVGWRRDPGDGAFRLVTPSGDGIPLVAGRLACDHVTAVAGRGEVRWQVTPVGLVEAHDDGESAPAAGCRPWRRADGTPDGAATREVADAGGVPFLRADGDPQRIFRFTPASLGLEPATSHAFDAVCAHFNDLTWELRPESSGRGRVTMNWWYQEGENPPAGSYATSTTAAINRQRSAGDHSLVVEGPVRLTPPPVGPSGAEHAFGLPGGRFPFDCMLAALTLRGASGRPADLLVIHGAGVTRFAILPHDRKLLSPLEPGGTAGRERFLHAANSEQWEAQHVRRRLRMAADGGVWLQKTIAAGGRSDSASEQQYASLAARRNTFVDQTPKDAANRGCPFLQPEQVQLRGRPALVLSPEIDPRTGLPVLDPRGLHVRRKAVLRDANGRVCNVPAAAGEAIIGAVSAAKAYWLATDRSLYRVNLAWARHHGSWTNGPLPGAAAIRTPGAGRRGR